MAGIGERGAAVVGIADRLTRSRPVAGMTG
jgi:hypothetical protein